MKLLLTSVKLFLTKQNNFTGIPNYLIGVYFICFVAIVVYFVFSVIYAIQKVNKIQRRTEEEVFENPVQF